MKFAVVNKTIAIIYLLLNCSIKNEKERRKIPILNGNLIEQITALSLAKKRVANVYAFNRGDDCRPKITPFFYLHFFCQF